MALTDKQQRFCEEYLISLNGTQAAIKAGYSKNSARQIAEENLSKPDIKEFIEKRQSELSDKLNITQEWVLTRLKSISDRCMQQEPVMVHNGEEWVESGEFKFDSSGANKATELIGKHLGMFITKMELDLNGAEVYIGGKKLTDE